MGAVGFYRTHYSGEALEALQHAISDNSLPPRDRLGLQNDLFALARAGQASTVDALKVASAFRSETNYTVWSDLTNNLGQIGIILQHSDCYDQFKVQDSFGLLTVWETKFLEHLPENRCPLYVLYKIPLAQANFLLAQLKMHLH